MGHVSTINMGSPCKNQVFLKGRDCVSLLKLNTLPRVEVIAPSDWRSSLWERFCLPHQPRGSLQATAVSPSDAGLPWGRMISDQSDLRFPRAGATGPPSTEVQGGQPASTILRPLMLQKEHQILREADFKKWLRSKLQPQGQSLTRNIELKPRAPTWAITPSETPKPPRRFHPSPEARLQQKLERKLQPFVRFLPAYRQPTIRRPELWNRSNNPARSPTAQIGYPQGIRLGVHPDPSLEHDFHGFVKVKSDGHGGARLHTVAGNQVGPVPQLPLEVIIRELYPLMQPYRMKVPQGFYSVSMKNVPQKRYLGDHTFWTDTLAMSLRETFDEAFLATVQAHQGLPALPSP